MKKIFKIFSFLTLFILVISCSTKRNAFFNRNYHAVTAKYNVLFNGEQAYEKGLKQIRESNKDNFWKRLPIEAIKFDEVKGIETDSLNPFVRAEEKAVKAIQKHSMEISGYERNRMIDDAYLLLGKSRYYTQRFIPAMEAFNYIITNYSDEELNYNTRIWRAKANVKIGNEKIAIETMKLLLEILNEQEKVPLHIQEKAHTALAIAYEKTDSIQNMVKHLKLATETSFDKDQSARNMFVLGQVYNELGQKDSAKYVFKDLIKSRRAPDKYKIYANIELAKNIEKDSISDSYVKSMKRLASNYLNRKYADKLYYSLGSLEKNRGNIEDAIKYYQKSLRVKDGDDIQKTYTYESLGNIYFNKKEYLLSGSYYDSVLNVVPKEEITNKRIRNIKIKNNGLASLKKFETISQKTDSILKLVEMTDVEREKFFKSYIEKIKEEDEKKAQLLANLSGGSNSFFGKLKNKGKWYFYNSQSKNIGKNEFQMIWGARKLEDNWRLLNKNKFNALGNDDFANPNIKINNRYELSSYLKAIPTNIDEINKLKKQRNDALYNLGLIYNQQFNNTELSLKNFEKLKEVSNDKFYELPLSYYLYQIYSQKGDTEKAEISKNIIFKNYPNSRYAQIIKNPKKSIELVKTEDAIVKEYKELYFLYKKGEYNEVVSRINSIFNDVKNMEVIPKLALLKAMSIGNLEGKEKYKEVLKEVIVNYPDTEEGKKAEEILKVIK